MTDDHEGKMSYPDEAILRARDGAMEWLEGRSEGYPRSWKQEEANAVQRGDPPLYDDFEAPPIAGYEALEREGLVARGETITRHGQERVHFRLVAPPRT